MGRAVGPRVLFVPAHLGLQPKLVLRRAFGAGVLLTLEALHTLLRFD